MSKKQVLTFAVLSIAVLALAACAPSYSSPSSGAAPAAAPTSAQAAAPTSAPTATSAPTTAPTTAPAATSAPAAAPTTAAPAGASVAVQVTQNATLGKFLADQNGRTLYVFLKDTKNVSNCTGNCATTWLPLKAQGKPTAQNGVDASLLGTIQRQDGGTQVTYNGQPLYHYAPDQAKGDTKGQGVGQLWYVVGPDGNPIKTTSSSAPAQAPTQAPAQAPAAQPTSPYHY